MLSYENYNVDVEDKNRYSENRKTEVGKCKKEILITWKRLENVILIIGSVAFFSSVVSCGNLTIADYESNPCFNLIKIKNCVWRRHEPSRGESLLDCGGPIMYMVIGLCLGIAELRLNNLPLGMAIGVCWSE